MRYQQAALGARGIWTEVHTTRPGIEQRLEIPHHPTDDHRAEPLGVSVKVQKPEPQQPTRATVAVIHTRSAVSDPKELYKALILEHHKNPRNEGSLDNKTHHARRANPLCGDRVDLDLRVDAGQVAELRFQVRGCALAKGSASIMTTLIEGRSAEDARALSLRLESLLKVGNAQEDEVLSALLGARAFPGRKRCVTLAWIALRDALDPNL